jgi:hypothetical protein
VRTKYSAASSYSSEGVGIIRVHVLRLTDSVELGFELRLVRDYSLYVASM